ncbi:MAG: hypothetical protein LBG72_10420 [Spirochaetaceae bacterium]|jgi:hypothetical protein|nr:hypothetical protein [Spirochaetaceae bacterium]
MSNKKICNDYDAYIRGCAVFADDEPDTEYCGAYSGIPLYMALRFWAHAFVCKKCAEKKRRVLLADRVLHSLYLPTPSANCEDTVMAAVLAEDAEAAKESDYFSLRGWAIAGIVIVASLLSVYFNMDFCGIAASAQGESFILPLAITIGAVITIYGALLIGSHLEPICRKLGIKS